MKIITCLTYISREFLKKNKGVSKIWKKQKNGLKEVGRLI